ncbi:DUF3849 domain-containing protein [uncultured Acetatifactor sp.]|uniref:DUF3849 domain-containing protein n=1 Tax=uncultured Acetatifactor sp. TaxID=1671927 RepID=UPI0026294091|nr:DUF3849 domain-containing protein [uncultured Acetatifactor sp.]
MADAKTEKQKVKEITDKLEEGLKELFESGKYKNYLSTMSKFHNYSVNNTLLIALQRPDASLVAGYQAWQKNFNRHVNKGEKGIRILAPAPYKIKEERDKLDPVTGEIMLDQDGMPQTEEVEIKIPAFRAVSVFDVKQTSGEPIPELEAKELLSTVEGYEDFVKAVTYVAPVPISFEDIPGDSKGFFSPTEKRIAVQEGMSESQTLKTMVHETAHSMLHDKEINKDILAPAKDRNTKEVEAESIAYTVCQHFGIDTAEYSFGYIAGWSSGRDMKELKSSLDTIRRTASELITGIEGQLRELQRDRELMRGQEKESLLLIQNRGLSEYSLVNVRGMDAAEIIEALLAMNDDDRLSVAAYLESKGAWTTEIANQDTKEFGEYHLDVRYYTDTNEIIDLKAEREWNERATEPVGADDVILKITHSNGFEVERITNKTPEEVREIMGALTKLEVKDRKNIHDFLESCGADYIPIIVDGGRNSGMPQFNDFEIDLDKKEVVMISHLSPVKQAEGIINRLEFAKTAFSDDERNLIVNYAFKLNDMEKTRELAEHIYYGETEDSQGAALAVIDAQAEIDALPDPMIGLWEMEEYGYTWNEMLPLTQGRALELFDRDLPVCLLHEDGSETTVHDRKQITGHGGIFGIEKGDWENEKNFRAMREELEESGADREAQLLHGDTDQYGIYQLKDNPGLRDFHFAGTEELLKRGILSDDFGEIQPGNYNLVYAGELSDIHGQSQREKLNAVFEKFNIDHPADYKGHSLSVSDVVVLHENGENSTHFVDSFGFTELPDFVRGLEGVKEQETQKAEPEARQETSGHDVQKPEAGQTEQETYPAFYGHTLSYAAEHGEVDRYMESHKFDRECKEAVEETIRQNFDGMHLKHDIVKPLAEKYGAERMAFILANTIQQESWDGRFSRDNKAWASEFYIPENIVHGIDMNRELIVGSHPAVLDGFIGMFRREALELEKEMSAGQEKAASGQDAQKPETGRPETEQTQKEQAETERLKPQAEQTGPGRLAKTPELEDLDEGDEIIDLGDEKDKVLAEMKQSLGGRQETPGHDVDQSAKQNDLKPEQTEPEEPAETELAFQIADRYISIQETEGGYDYSIMGLDYKEIDGGVYDNPGIGIKEAINEIVEDLKIIPFDNGARGNIHDGDRLIMIDYDGLMEKAEAANAVMPQSDVVADFKAKTNELFHEISEMNPAEIEETVKCHVQAQLDESGIDAVIVDAAVAGSRCRGLEQEGSDLDVVVELSTNEREDALFDMFNESGLHIGGVKVDINPITAQRTGSLETYLPQVEDYLEGVREARERDLAASISREENQKETKESLFPEQAETEVTLTVAECGEFHNLGEFYENIPTMEEAVAIWRQIPPERMHGIPAIGVNIHTPGTEAFEDVGIDILTGKRIDLDILEYIPDIKGNPQAMKVIAELAAKLPEMEIDGRMSEEFEAKVWEKRMPDLTSAEQLAVELDRFTYDYDTALYRDSSQSMTENVSEIAEALKQRDTHDIALWLADIAADGTVPEERKRAMELLEKLAEYKPLAKIEEMEEQNYNMVDNVLNNGAGEKAQKEENKKAQEKPVAKPSLKARLAEKKAQAAGQGHEENIKNKQREM